MVFQAFPADHADPNHNGNKDLLASFRHDNKKPHFISLQRYDLQPDEGSFTEKYRRAGNQPVFRADGNLAYILHTAEDITLQVKAEKREAQCGDAVSPVGISNPVGGELFLKTKTSD